MATVTLRYELQRDTGLPRVTVVEGELTESERSSLDTELRWQYERLVRCRPAVVRLRTRLAGLAVDAPFRLRILPGINPYTDARGCGPHSSSGYFAGGRPERPPDRPSRASRQ